MGLQRTLSKVKSVDFFKKIPSDLTEATLTGAWISIVAAIAMLALLFMEFWAFIQVSTSSELVVDRSSPHDLLKVSFNISFPALSCEFATLDVSDALGTKRLNLTKTLRKVPVNIDLERVGSAVEDKAHGKGPKYDEEGTIPTDDVDISKPITAAHFQEVMNRYPIVIINFYAPWCHWCQQLEPTWEAATKEVHDKYPEWDGRIRLAKVDCTAEQKVCRDHFISAFPSIRVFRKGHDDIVVSGARDHEAYTGDRTKLALVSFADGLVPSAGQPHKKVANLHAAPTASGCNLAGFVLVKKVPGTLHFVARGDGHSFDHSWMNMTHMVHQFYFGTRPTPRKYYQLKKLHPMGLQPDWMDKLHDQVYISEHAQHTHEHYVQVVMTTVEPKGGRQGSMYDAYEYIVHSHTYQSDATPSAKFSYDLSPIQIVVKEEKRRWYHFLTTTCAIIGGVFTVAGILDSILYQSLKLARKVDLGKQG